MCVGCYTRQLFIGAGGHTPIPLKLLTVASTRGTRQPGHIGGTAWESSSCLINPSWLRSIARFGSRCWLTPLPLGNVEHEAAQRTLELIRATAPQFSPSRFCGAVLIAGALLWGGIWAAQHNLPDISKELDEFVCRFQRNRRRSASAERHKNSLPLNEEAPSSWQRLVQ